jgi:hypothetical protein
VNRSSVANTPAVEVFAKACVEYPMQLVFNLEHWRITASGSAGDLGDSSSSRFDWRLCRV